jgi:hypothetical protein
MSSQNTPTTQENSDAELAKEDFAEGFETAAEYHRMAARHFSVAAKHHLAAAIADDEGNSASTAHHAFQAFRHQLNAVQYAEIAVMDNDSLEEDDNESP